MSWAEQELSEAKLGDKRRNKRLVAIVEDLAQQPNESVSQAVTVHFPRTSDRYL